MSRSPWLRSLLEAGGLPASRVERVVARLERIAKRTKTARRRAAMPAIDRERKTVLRARTVMADHLTPFLAKQARGIAEQITSLRASLGKLAKAEGDPPTAEQAAAAARALADDVLAKLDLGDWSSLVPQVQPILLKIADDGITVGFEQLGVTPTAEITEQVNRSATAWASDRAAELVGMRIDDDGNLVENPDAEWAITDGTRALLRGDVVRAIEEGASTDDLAAALEDSYTFSPDRAQTIARTELARADVQGNMTAYRDSGVVGGKEWILGSEHIDDDECDEAAAMGVVPLDDDFGGLGDPPAHPNCVCDVFPVLASDMDD
jgi:hypothetical protein